MKSGTVRRICM